HRGVLGFGAQPQRYRVARGGDGAHVVGVSRDRWLASQVGVAAGGGDRGERGRGGLGRQRGGEVGLSRQGAADVAPLGRTGSRGLVEQVVVGPGGGDRGEVAGLDRRVGSGTLRGRGESGGVLSGRGAKRRATGEVAIR